LTPSWRFIQHSTTRCAIFAEASATFVQDRPISIRIMADKHAQPSTNGRNGTAEKRSSGHQLDAHLDRLMTNQLVLNRLYCLPNSLITRVEIGQNNTVAYWLNVRPHPAAPCRSRAHQRHGDCTVTAMPRLPLVV
jgi:hypothetical protein